MCSQFEVEWVVNWTFPDQSNKEKHFRRCRFSRKDHQKRLQNYVPKNTRAFRKVDRTIMAGGMSTTTDNTMMSWDYSVFLGDDRQKKCLDVDV